MTTETQATGTDTTQAGVQAGADGKPVGTDAATTADPQTTTTTTDPTKADPAKEVEVAYEFKAPEGMELDKDSLAEFTTIAKELKLPADQAQKVVDIAVKREVARAEAHARQISDWADAVKADKELGGDKLPQTLAITKKALDLGPPELKELLNSSGLGNHPAVVKWAYAVGKALSEDTFKGGQPPPASGDMATRLYGNTPAAKT